MVWQTPDNVLEKIRELSLTGEIGLDPCTVPENPTRARTFYTPAEDGLARPWSSDKGIVYCNPPYGRELALWARKLVSEVKSGRVREAALLVPARTDTSAFHTWIGGEASAIAFLKGRIRFRGAPAGAPFPTLIAYYGINGGRL